MEKTRNEVSAKLAYIDLKAIVGHYRDPALWEREWTLYESAPVRITWRISSIDVERRVIVSKVSIPPFTMQRGPLQLIYPGEWLYCSSIPYDNPEYTQEALNKNLLSTALNLLIICCEHHLIKQYAEWREAASLKDEQESGVRETADGILDEFLASHRIPETLAKHLRESFVDEYVDALYDDGRLSDFTSEVEARYRFKVLGHVALALCSWFGDEKEFRYYRPLVGDGAKGHIWSKMRAEARRQQTDEWRDRMENDIKEALEG